MDKRKLFIRITCIVLAALMILGLLTVGTGVAAVYVYYEPGLQPDAERSLQLSIRKQKLRAELNMRRKSKAFCSPV